MKIQPYTHRCTVRDGAAAGNKHSNEVTPFEIDQPCEVCGEPLATIEDIVTHIYAELIS